MAVLTVRICPWSGPRSVSTALMYAFAQRADTRVVDEPLYAHYLQVSGARHPGREAVLRSQDSVAEQVIRDLILGPCDRPVLFMKHMAHHLVEIDWGFLYQTINVLLVREPESVLTSLSKVIDRPSANATGWPLQQRILEHTLACGQTPLVIDARTLLTAPGCGTTVSVWAPESYLYPGDAVMGGRWTSRRRYLGQTLVPCGAPLDRVWRTAPGPEHGSRFCAPGARDLPAPLRNAAHLCRCRPAALNRGAVYREGVAILTQCPVELIPMVTHIAVTRSVDSSGAKAGDV